MSQTCSRRPWWGRCRKVRAFVPCRIRFRAGSARTPAPSRPAMPHPGAAIGPAMAYGAVTGRAPQGVCGEDRESIPCQKRAPAGPGQSAASGRCRVFCPNLRRAPGGSQRVHGPCMLKTASPHPANIYGPCGAGGSFESRNPPGYGPLPLFIGQSRPSPHPNRRRRAWPFGRVLGRTQIRPMAIRAIRPAGRCGHIPLRKRCAPAA